MLNEGIKGRYPPCDQCQKSGNSKGCILPTKACTPVCLWCQKSKVKCHFEVTMTTMEQSVSGEKHKESNMLATMIVTSEPISYVTSLDLKR